MRSDNTEAMRIINNAYNAKNIASDNGSAKSSGMSYGKYKAGMKLDFEESEYAVNPAPYLTKTEKKESKKPVAHIL